MKLPLRIEIFVITLASKGTYRQGFLMPDFENQRFDVFPNLNTEKEGSEIFFENKKAVHIKQFIIC